MEYGMVAKMKVDELKKYLRLRGISVTGIKAELVARAFVAMEAKTAAEIESDLQTEYQAKLLHWGNYSSRSSLFNFWLAWRG